MNIHFFPSSSHILSIFRESFSLTAQQKKIIGVVSIALGLLAAGYVTFRCILNGRASDVVEPIIPEEDDEEKLKKNPKIHLVKISQDPLLSKEISLVLPSPLPFDSKAQKSLEKEVQECYEFCQSKSQPLIGDEGMTFSYDLSKKQMIIQNSEGENKIVNQIELTTYNIEGKCASLEWKFDIEGKQERYITPSTDNGISSCFMNGNEHERTFHDLDMFPPVPKEIWDHWEEGFGQAETQHYERAIYPEIVTTIEKICAMNPQHKLDIMDLGGGSGKLAGTILDKFSGSIRKVVVIDSSVTLIDKAKKRASQHPKLLIPKCIDIEEISEKLYDSKEYKQSTDIVILCGVVAHQVLSKDLALDIISKCHSILRKNGFIIAASLSPSLLNSSEYEEMGYQVLNKTIVTKSIRGPRFPAWTTNDFYIMQKKDD